MIEKDPKRLNDLPEKLYPEFKPSFSNLKSGALSLIPNLVEPSKIVITMIGSNKTHYWNHKETNASPLLILIPGDEFISEMCPSSLSLPPGS